MLVIMASFTTFAMGAMSAIAGLITLLTGRSLGEIGKR